MDDNDLLRYSRQIMLPQFDIAGQQTLIASKVLILGLGGLGSPIALYLAAAGVGHLVLCDDDVVDLSNLQRQIIHDTDDIGQLKVDSAERRLKALNPNVVVSKLPRRLTAQTLKEQAKSLDLVIDGSDNFTTRFMVNAVCVDTKTPLISGAAIRMEGQVSVFRPDLDNTPCYRCLYDDHGTAEGETVETCSESGVLAPIVGIIGSIVATEAIKVLTSMGDTLAGKVLVMDATTMEWRTMTLKKDPECPVCSH
jgi:adenylyltransferase/sulfurtransferase